MSERVKMSDIDTNRFEWRYALPEGQSKEFVRNIKKFLRPIYFSKNHYSQTIYLNTDHLDVPWDFSLRARKYIRHPDRYIALDYSEKFICEIKKEQYDLKQATKVRKTMAIPEFCGWSKSKFKKAELTNLRPFIATQYKRQHFIAPGRDDFRLTVDTEIKYGYFDSDNQFYWLARDYGARIEIKSSQGAMKSRIVRQVIDELNKKDHFFTVRKKSQAYDLLKKEHQKKLPKLKNELGVYRIESMLDLKSSNPFQSFISLRNDLSAGKVSNYGLDYSTNIELSSSTNYLFAKKKFPGSRERIAKLVFKMNRFHLIKKIELNTVKDPYNLNTVTKRHEYKSKWFAFTSPNIKKFRDSTGITPNSLDSFYDLQRNRLIVYPVNKKTNRVYSISLVKNISGNKADHQIEIEYQGTLKEKINQDVEDLIVNEIADLTKKILTYFIDSHILISPTRI